MVPVDRAVLVQTVIHLVAGVIANTMDQGDGFKVHAMKLNGIKIVVKIYFFFNSN